MPEHLWTCRCLGYVEEGFRTGSNPPRTTTEALSSHPVMQQNDHTNLLRLALVGYGQMGREIERLAPERGFRVAARYDSRTPLGDEPGGEFDVAVEFTRPETAPANMERLLMWRKPVVVGTTGWMDRLRDVEALVKQHEGRLIYASNFSIGVNIFFRLLHDSVKLFDEQEMYDAAVHEIHHTRKADSPSGTALTAAGILLGGLRRKGSILTGPPDGRIAPDALHVTSQRLGSTIGTHTVTFDSEADTLELTHRAKNRSGFALGALLAAQWITAREPGLYRFEDLF